MHGECVTKIEAPAELSLHFASFAIQFDSACSTSTLVFPFSSSQLLSKPGGVPLYPIDNTLPSFTAIAHQPSIFLLLTISQRREQLP